tara:strand:- start:518 stop:2857 length:2340 start_codon:yes stop_codon:yes gene_type:complete
MSKIVIFAKRKKLNLKIYITSLIFLILHVNLNAQIIQGKISSNMKNVPYANVFLNGTNIGVSADEYGNYVINSVELGNQHIVVTAIGMVTKKIYVDITEGVNTVDIELESNSYDIDQVVVTGTKTFKRKTESPIIVNVIDSRKLQSVQACNLSDGLNFHSGIRVETDCQTCNYTQLRMNGLGGGYSQILVNGRPIFSPLTGLYGMEQIPINMIDRIEVVKGGGSSLYGSSSIGGIVNVITKIPKNAGFSFGYDYGSINSVVDDKVLFGNSTVLAENKNAGASFFVNNRDREWYDHNNDNYSELPILKDNTFGVNFFFLPSENQKIEVNFASLHEYRYGGEMVLGTAHFAMQAEERIHDILLGNVDYQINFNNESSSLITYLASQQTQRDHYTGIRPDIGSIDDEDHLSSPPYGTSLNVTNQIGFQLNHEFNNFLGSNVITFGSEYKSDCVTDEIIAYNYLIDQRVKTLGTFLQSDWKILNDINLLSGARLDNHSLLEDAVVSPRMSILFKIQNNSQLRLSYSTGFRAPQAFDADLHISFAGGGVSRIELADDLKEEKSKSLSASFNYDKAASYYIYGLTLEGFYTRLEDAFYQDPIGEDQYGRVFVKRNGDGASVKGVSLEFRSNYDQKLQLESGFTIQRSLYDNEISYSDELSSTRVFLRTPNNYGYATIDYTPSNWFKFSTNLVHTGKMDLVHMGGSQEQENDEYKTSDTFNVIGFKTTYIQKIERVGVTLEYSLGVKNLLNDYQNDFDTGKDRDSNFIYGPSTPRTFYVGLVMKSM